MSHNNQILDNDPQMGGQVAFSKSHIVESKPINTLKPECTSIPNSEQIVNQKIIYNNNKSIFIKTERDENINVPANIRVLAAFSFCLLLSLLFHYAYCRIFLYLFIGCSH